MMLFAVATTAFGSSSTKCPTLAPRSCTATFSAVRAPAAICRLDLGQPETDDDDDAGVSSSTSTTASTPAALPDGWDSAVDPASGKTYYYNEATGESTWTLPAAATVATTEPAPAAASTAVNYEAAIAAMPPPPPPADAATRMADAQRVLKWVETCGGSVSAVRAVSSPSSGGGLGLAAYKSVRRGEELVSVPLSLGLSAESALRSAMGPYIAEFDPELADYAFIALALLHERSLGKESKLAPWLVDAPALMPAQGFAELPLLWGSEGLAELDAATTTGAARRAAAIAADYNWLQANVFSAAPDLFPRSIFSPEGYTCAVALAFSRSVAIAVDESSTPAPVLLPVLDLLNHQTGGSAPSAALKAAKSGKGLGAALFGGGDVSSSSSVSLIVSGGGSGEVGEGDEVRIRYGGSTAGELLLDHGLLDAPVAPVAALTFALKDDDAYYDEKADVLETSAGLGVEATWLLSEDGAEAGGESLPAELLSFLRLKHMSGADAFLLEPVFIDSIWPEHLPLPVSQENEEAALRDCQAAIDAALAQLGGSVQSDLRTLAEADAASRPYALSSVRYAERRALQAASRAVSAQLAGLDGLEYYQTRRLAALGLNPVETEEELEALTRAAGRMTGASDYGDW